MQLPKVTSVKSKMRTVARFTKALLLFAAIFFALAVAASAQADAQDGGPPGASSQQPHEDYGAPAAEALRRAEIRHEEESNKEMVERAGEAAKLGDEILSSYKKNNSLNPDDFKKLDRLDKIAHKIRSNAGGSDDADLDDPPSRLEDAVKRLADAADLLNKNAQKTSRLVVSGEVIKHSNELIELIKRIRGFGH
jgi:hypothetical protein